MAIPFFPEAINADTSLADIYEFCRNRAGLFYSAIDSDGQFKKAEDGSIFSSDGKTLWLGPPGYSGTYHVPPEVIWIARGAFRSGENLDEVVIAESCKAHAQAFPEGMVVKRSSEGNSEARNRVE